MKQLLFHFMFFVLASLFFIQCAKLFPTVDNTSARKPAIGTNFKKISFKKPVKNSSSISGVSFNIAKEKNNIVWPFFNSSFFNHNVFSHINSSNLFDEPYINFAYDKFVRDFQNNDGEQKQ